LLSQLAQLSEEERALIHRVAPVLERIASM
jgi:hypothetical protein